MQKFTRTLAMASAIAFAGVLAGCGDDVTVDTPTTISVTPPSASLKVGEAVTLTASVSTSNANKGVTWASSGTNATVDANGKVTAVAQGNATITATAAADPGVKASALITITGKGVTAVVVSPSNDILAPGTTRQLAANVTADPGVARTVTWTSSANAIATVSAAGVVSAVTPGNAIITAASTVDPTVSGTMALTVRQLQAAAVSIQKITTGNTNTIVNPNNVAGQINVTLNVDPGEQTVTKVEVLLGTVVACTVNLSASESEQQRMAAAFENVEAADVNCPINTAEFSSTTGVAKYLNGTYQISARATLGGTTPGNVSSQSQALTFNNQSGFIALVSNTNTAGGPASAINPTTGRKWVQGDVTLKLAAVNYTAGGATLTSLNATFLGKTITGKTPDAGTQVFTIVFPASNTPANPLNLQGYQLLPANLAESMPVVTSSNLSNGNSGPTAIVNIGTSADDLGLARLDSTRVDNVAPATPTVGAFPTWLNASFAFTTTTVGVTGISDTGVDNVTTEFYVIKGTLPTAACDLAGMTKVTTSAGLVESTSTEMNGKIVLSDALGNKVCVPFTNAFGVDTKAPGNVALAGVTNLQAFGTASAGTNASGTNYTVTSDVDTLSGLPATNPALVSIARLGATSATNACVIGTGTYPNCVAVAAGVTASITGGQTTEGYYTLTAQMRDSAGNFGPVPSLSRTFLVDATSPTFSGGLVLATSYAGGAAAAIGGVSVTDNIDLSRILGQVSYSAAGIALEYASQQLGSFGTPLEKTFSGTYTIPSLIRCVAPAAGPFTASNTNKASELTVIALDQANNIGTKVPAAGDFNSRVADCGVVGNQGAFAMTGLATSAPSYGTGKSQVSVGGTTTGVNTESVTLTAVATLALDAPNPFSRVEFYYLDPITNGYVLIGQASGGSPAQTTVRTWTYTLAWNPVATVPVGTLTVIAIGVDADSDAAASTTTTVTVAP